MKTFSNAIDIGEVTTAEAWNIFDGLDPVDIPFMLGAWQGATFPTQHPLDGVLEAYHWHGKRFDSPEHVHPLVFKALGGNTASINPLVMLPFASRLDRLPFPRSKAIGRIFQLCLPLLTTRRSGARLRLTHYRGKESATMIYDAVPINDIFRKVDDHTLLGVMDLKGMDRPFFFVLRRESVSNP